MTYRRITLVIFLLTWMVNFIFAQDNSENSTLKYFNKTEVGIGIGFGSFGTDNIRGYVKKAKNNQIIVSPQTINGILISGRIGLGVGLCAEFWQKGMFYPVFAHLSYDFKLSDNTPFAYIDLGEAFGKRDSTSSYQSGTGGLLFRIGVGFKKRIGKRFQFDYEVFYRYQAITSNYRTYYDTIPSHYTTTEYKVPYNFVGFKIGIMFK
jgi:hypothetical protein